MRLLLCLLILILVFSYGKTTDLLSKFNVTIKIPENSTSLRQLPYTSIQVKYVLPDGDARWTIVGVEPLIQSSKRIIQQINVHLCQAEFDSHIGDAVWYDNELHCQGDRSLIIYQWTSYSSLSPWQISDNAGFELDKSKYIVLNVTYFEEQQPYDDQSGVIIYMSSFIPRFLISSMIVGKQGEKKRFSCRISNHPRLLYGIKQLFPKSENGWWRIYFIRFRIFGRNIFQSVYDSSINSNRNRNTSDIESIPSYIFLNSGDYLIIECETNSTMNCEFLFFFKYKKAQIDYFTTTNHICEDDDYPSLFKLLPSRNTLDGGDKILSKPVSTINGITIFVCILLSLLVIWISIIFGCIIMRRARGLVNLRKEASIIGSNRSKGTGLCGTRQLNDTNQRTMAAADRTAQLDIEHMGLMG